MAIAVADTMATAALAIITVIITALDRTGAGKEVSRVEFLHS